MGKASAKGGDQGKAIELYKTAQVCEKQTVFVDSELLLEFDLSLHNLMD